MDQIRDIAARFNDPPGPADLADIAARRSDLRAMGVDGRPRTARSARRPRRRPPARAPAGTPPSSAGAIYWSPASGARTVTGEIYKAWGSLGFERGALGLPTSGEIQEPLWIVQNFQHGTLNFDREKGTVTRVIDGVPVELPTSDPTTRRSSWSGSHRRSARLGVAKPLTDSYAAGIGAAATAVNGTVVGKSSLHRVDFDPSNDGGER